MASRRRSGNPAAPIVVEDTEDILQEVGAEVDEETGVLVADKDAVRSLGGAIDPESVIENRKRRALAARRRKGEKVPFGGNDVLEKYGELLDRDPAGSFYIKVTRMTGPEMTEYIRSAPGSSLELFEALKAIHGQNPSYQYMLEVKSKHKNTHATSGRVSLPDTRPPHMRDAMPYYPPPQSPPTAPQAPIAAPTDMFSQMSQMFELFQRMQGQRQQGAQPAQPAQPAPNPMSQMEQMFEMFQRMQQGLPPQPQPQVVQQAPPQPPPPPLDPMQSMRQMFEMFREFQAMMPKPEPPRPQFNPERRFGPPHGVRPEGPPVPQRGPAETIRQAITEIRSFRDLAREIDGVIPGAQERDEGPEEPDEDSTYITEEIGKVKVVKSRADGKTDLWASGLANLPDALKFVSETYDKLKRDADERQRQQQRRVLPQGYIEVTPGQPVQAPPGYRAVILNDEEAAAVEQEAVVTPAPASQRELPPPPTNVPPPLREDPSPPQRAWGLPTIPDES